MSKSKVAVVSRPPTRTAMAATAVGTLISFGILWLAGMAVSSDLASFRSCSSNNTGLYVRTCGKQGLNTSDIFLLILFILAGCMVVSLLTAAWRMIRRPSS